MPGNKITKRCIERLNAYGEEKIFELYLKHRNVRALLKNLPKQVGSMSSGPFYAWLKEDPTEGRWNRWQATKSIIASDLVEEGLKIVDDADDGSVSAARLRAEQRRWIAERYDRKSYGKTEQITAPVQIFANTFLADLKLAEAEAEEERKIESTTIEEADYEVVEDTED